MERWSDKWRDGVVSGVMEWRDGVISGEMESQVAN